MTKKSEEKDKSKLPSKIETIDVTLRIPEGVFDYIETLADKTIEEYCVHLIVEGVYMDLGNTQKPDEPIKKHDLAKVFENHNLDTEFLLK